MIVSFLEDRRFAPRIFDKSTIYLSLNLFFELPKLISLNIWIKQKNNISLQCKKMLSSDNLGCFFC